MLPFAAIGLLIATLCSGQASPAIINLIYLPMAFLSGLWMPLSILPGWIAGAAPVWPSYHLAQIARFAIGITALNNAVGTHGNAGNLSWGRTILGYFKHSRTRAALGDLLEIEVERQISRTTGQARLRNRNQISCNCRTGTVFQGAKGTR